MKHIGLVFSDLHVGSTVGLLHTNGATLDDGSVVKPNAAQEWLYDQWLHLLRQVKQLYKRGDQIYAFGVGDLVDNINKSTQIWSRNDVDLVKACAELLQPVRDMANGGFFVVRGTPAHVGAAGALEEALAMNLKATRLNDEGPYSHYILHVDLDGVLLQFAHHGRTGRKQHTITNTMGDVVSATVLDAVRSDKRIPNVLFRGHTHISYDSGANYLVRVIQLPAFQLATEFGTRIAPGEDAHIGGAVFTVEGGKFSAELYRYFCKPDPKRTVWTSKQTKALPNFPQF